MEKQNLLNGNLIFIPFNTPSLKNSKIKTTRGIFSSPIVKKYLSNLGIHSYSVRRKEVLSYKTKENIIEKLRPEFEKELNGINPPFEIGFHFVRDSKRKFDFHNIVQIIADLLVAHNIIKDDNMDFFLPYPLNLDDKFYSVDKNNPGVYLYIKKT